MIKTRVGACLSSNILIINDVLGIQATAYQVLHLESIKSLHAGFSLLLWTFDSVKALMISICAGKILFFNDFGFLSILILDGWCPTNNNKELRGWSCEVHPTMNIKKYSLCSAFLCGAAALLKWMYGISICRSLWDAWKLQYCEHLQEASWWWKHLKQSWIFFLIGNEKKIAYIYVNINLYLLKLNQDKSLSEPINMNYS